MMNFKRISVLLSFFISLIVLSSVISAAVYEEVPQITGETSRTVENITLSDGTDTGVKYTTINLSGHYGTKVLRITEFSLSDTHLSFNVINNGTYLVSKKTVASAALAYTNANAGRTVLSAVNGDLYFNAIHSGTSVTKSVLSCPRGVMVVDGEIWATEQIGMENYCATNNEKGTVSPDKTSFGVTFSNQPLVGSPVIKIYIKNETSGAQIPADGLNRLPCLNSIIVYNNRINSSNYALNDSYEIELEAIDTPAFVLGKTTKAIVRRIYPSNSETRPSISSKTIIITSRGTAIEKVNGQFSVGDIVSFSNTVVDRYGNTELWKNVKDAIGGHMTVLYNGNVVNNLTGGEYPTTLIGYKDDGTVMFACVSPTVQGKYLGLKQSQAVEFCRELGYNSVFYLDGGGSTETVVLKDGTYTMRNYTSDSSTRAVINSVSVCFNTEKVVDKQGTLSYINVPINLAKYSPVYLDGAILTDLNSNSNYLSTEYDSSEKAFKMSVTSQTVDPYTLINYSRLSRVNAEDYPYIVLKVKNGSYRENQFKLYFSCGSTLSLNETNTASFNVDSDASWHYYMVNMSKKSGWNGELIAIRLDPFNDVTSYAGDEIFVGAVILCKSKTEAEAVINGALPDNCISDYLEYKESIQNKDPVEEPDDDPTQGGGDDPAEEPSNLPEIGPMIDPVPAGTTADSILDSLSDEFIILDSEGNVVQEGSVLCTGYTLCEYNSEKTDFISSKYIIVLGDITGNGKVTSKDALLALKFSSGLIDLDPPFAYASDINSDTRVTSGDALKILKYSAGLINSLN